MRLFLAIALNDAVRAACAGVAEDLERRLARAGARRAVKWVERENLHVTLRFLGEVEEPRVAPLLERLSAPLDLPPFEIRVGGGGAFPASGPPRVTWIGVRDGEPRVHGVFDALDSRLVPLAFERETRPFTPHVTLGRVREIDRGPGRELRQWLSGVPVDLGAQPVSQVTLFRSHLSPQGPRHEVLREMSLRGGDATR